MSKTILALVPHPDDAEFYAGGTIARIVQEGARAILVVATDGRCGSFGQGGEALASIRAEEARRAAAVLGAQPPLLLGYHDFGLEALPAGTLRERFMRVIREYRPDVVIAEDPWGPFEPHPDHRAVAWAAMEAINYAPLPLIHPEHRAAGLEPHFVLEKYFYAEHSQHCNRVVDISTTMDRKLAALAEHVSQVEFLVDGILRQAALAGLDPRAVVGDMAADRMTLLAWGLQVEAAEVGRKAGVRFGEAFRYQRFDPLIEGVLAQAEAEVA